MTSAPVSLGHLARKGRVWSPSEVAGLSHDLKTPLNQLIGYTELMMEIAQEEGLNEIVATLGGVRRATGSVLEVINVWLDDRGEGTSIAYLCVFRDRLLRAIARMNRLLQNAMRELDNLSTGTLRADGNKLMIASQRLAGLATQMFTRAGGDPAAAVRPPTAVAESPLPSDGDGARDKVTVLIVDDQAGNREVIARFLERQGYLIGEAADGLAALDRLAERPFDLVLLDIRMPGLDGLGVLSRIKNNPALSSIPVIMISAADETDTVVKCIELGAEDYIPKPFNPVLLRARIGISLERRRLYNEDRKNTQDLKAAILEAQHQRAIAEDLLRNILPERVAAELREKGSVDPMYFADVTILFADFVGFGKSTEHLAAEELVSVLNDYFTGFDLLVERYGLEKLKTIGDCYMCVSGIPVHTSSHPVDTVLAAIEMLDFVRERARAGPVDWKIRIGIHTGPVIAGVVGVRKFAFDIWGDSVNFASRMQSLSDPNRVNISDKTYARVKDFFCCERRGNVRTKDDKEVETYLVNGLAPALRSDAAEIPPPAFRRRYRIYFQKEPGAFPATLAAPEAPRP